MVDEVGAGSSESGSRSAGGVLVGVDVELGDGRAIVDSVGDDSTRLNGGSVSNGGGSVVSCPPGLMKRGRGKVSRWKRKEGREKEGREEERRRVATKSRKGRTRLAEEDRELDRWHSSSSGVEKEIDAISS